MARHPVNDDELISYAAGDLSPARAREISRHMEECPVCRATVEGSNRTVALMRRARAPFVDPPAATQQRARTLFGTIRPDLLGAAPRVWDSRLREILASIVFDSQAALALDGLRATAASTRQLSYESALADLDLQIAPLVAATGEARWRVMGQLTTAGPAPGLRAELESQPERESARPVTVPIDEDGYFVAELPAGRYTLRIPIGDSVLLFPDLDLR